MTDVDGDGATDLSDTIIWSFLVQNTGTTTITNLAVNDAKAGAVSCPATSLAPGASTTCTSAAYTIVQADVDAGVVSNTATATGKSPAGATVTSNSSHTDTAVTRTSNLKLVKKATVADVNGDFKTDLGDTITWTFKVTNSGTTTLTSVSVIDPTAGAVSCPLTSLTPGSTTTCTSTAPHRHPGRRGRRRGQQHRDAPRPPTSAACPSPRTRRPRPPRSRRPRRCS